MLIERPMGNDYSHVRIVGDGDAINYLVMIR